MKKYIKRYLILIILSLLVLSPNVYAEETEEDLTQYRTEENKIAGEPYLNPKWIEWNNLSDEEKAEWEVIPQKLIYDFFYNKTDKEILQPYNYGIDYLKPIVESLPSKYNLKDEGYVSPIKNQGSLGLCWDFATIGALESNVLKTMGKSLIFSERQIDYAISDPSTSITEGYNPYGDSNRTLGEGGYFELTENVFLGGISPVLTNVWGSYSTSSAKKSLSKVINDSNVAYQVTETTNFPYLDIKTATKDEKLAYREMIKEHIVNYGGVYVSTIVPDSRSGTCYNSSYNMIYQTSDCTFSDENPYHALLVIGWDDTYGPDEDGDGKGDGAWILKNSWGTSDHPYPYLSYNSIDLAFNGVVSVIEKDWDNNYNYHDIHKTNVMSSNSSEYTTTFKFYKDKDNKEILNRLSFIPYADREYSIYISTTGNAENNILIKKFTLDKSGIYSINTENIELNNSSFTITIKSDYIIPTNLNVYTSDVEENSEQKVSTFIENDFLGFNKTTSSSISSFDLATFTNNIESGTKVNYKIYKDSTEVTNLFTIPVVYIINDSSVANIQYDKSVIEYGNYTIETYIDSKIVNTYNFIIGGELVEDIYVPSKIVLLLGETRILPIKVKNSSANDQSMTYTFLDNEIATLDETGKLIGQNIGTTILTVSTNDNSDIERKITIEVKKLDGDGTESNPYIITDKYDLYLIKNNLGSSYKILNDITFTNDDFEINGDFYNSGNNWYSISSFSGTLDGNNKTIKGLRVYRGYSDINMGMFSQTDGATIKNIIFDECSTGAISGNFGIVTGTSINSTFENIIISNSKVNLTNKSNGGAIVGSDDSSVFKNVSSINNKIGGTSGQNNKKIGGIVGISQNSLFINVNNTSEIYGSVYCNMGGLIGESTNSSVINSFNTGKVRIIGQSYSSAVDAGTAGGLVGTSIDSTIITSYNTGSITGRYTMGGIVGKASNTFIKDVYNNGEITPYIDSYSWGTHTRTFTIGGIIGQSENSLLNNVFSLVSYDEESIKSNDKYCSTKSCTMYLGGISGHSTDTKVNNYYSTFKKDEEGSEFGYTSSSNISNNKIQLDYIAGLNFGTSVSNICSMGYNCDDIWEKKEDVAYITLKNEDLDFNKIITGKKDDVISNIFYPFDNIGDNLNFTKYDSNIISITNEQINLLNFGSTSFDISSNIGSNLKKSITVNVIDKVIKDIVIENNTLDLGLNESASIDYTITPDDASIKQLEWNIDNADIATVDENGVITGISEGTTNLTVKTIDGSNISKNITIIVKDYDIKSNYFIIDNSKINKIFTNLTYDNFLQNIKINSSYSFGIFKDEVEIDYTSKTIATGMKLKTIKNDALVKEYNLIVSGDITGDGSANAADILAQKLHILNKKSLTDEYFVAGDINEDGKVNATDIMYIKMYILGRYSTVWGK